MKTPCPVCASRSVIPLVHGMPGHDDQARADRGEIVLAGCVIGPGPMFEFACTVCGYRFTTVGLNDDLDDVRMTALLPDSWADLQCARPSAGAGYLDPLGRVLIRSYDTKRYLNRNGGFDDPDWTVSADRMRQATGVRVGDTVLYLGITRGYEQITLWPPARVLWLGALGRKTERWAMTLTSNKDDDSLIEVDGLPPALGAVIRAAADSLDPVSSEDCAQMLSYFGYGGADANR